MYRFYAQDILSLASNCVCMTYNMFSMITNIKMKLKSITQKIIDFS